MPSFDAEVTVTETATVEFEVFCGTCGAGLCSSSTGGNAGRRGTPFVSVDACQACMEKEYDRGHDAGYDVGYKEAQEAV